MADNGEHLCYQLIRWPHFTLTVLKSIYLIVALVFFLAFYEPNSSGGGEYSQSRNQWTVVGCVSFGVIMELIGLLGVYFEIMLLNCIHLGLHLIAVPLMLLVPYLQWVSIVYIVSCIATAVYINLDRKRRIREKAQRDAQIPLSAREQYLARKTARENNCFAPLPHDVTVSIVPLQSRSSFGSASSAHTTTSTIGKPLAKQHSSGCHDSLGSINLVSHFMEMSSSNERTGPIGTEHEDGTVSTQF